MPKFGWKAATPAGDVRTGVYQAVDAREVADRLRNEGMSVLSVSERKWPPTNIHLESISRRDLINFTYKLVPLLASKMALHRALDIMKGQVNKHRIKNALVMMRQDISNGASLSQAMQRHPDIFDARYVASVQAGEASGNMVRSISTMGAFLEWLDVTSKTLWAVLSYPILVVVALTILSLVLGLYAIPVFIKLYKQLGLAMKTPWPTKVIFAYSYVLTHYWLVFVIVFALIVLVFLLRNRIPGLRPMMDRMVLRTPYFGEIIRKIQSLQFCRFFQLLYDNGIDTKRSIDQARGVVTNTVIGDAVEFTSRQLEAGTALSKGLQLSGEFPNVVWEQIQVGEESGNVGEALEYVIRYYDFELDYSIKQFTAFLRPALVALLAGVLLILALGFYLPLFEIATLLNQ